MNANNLSVKSYSGVTSTAFLGSTAAADDCSSVLMSPQVVSAVDSSIFAYVSKARGGQLLYGIEEVIESLQATGILSPARDSILLRKGVGQRCGMVVKDSLLKKGNFRLQRQYLVMSLIVLRSPQKPDKYSACHIPTQLWARKSDYLISRATATYKWVYV